VLEILQHNQNEASIPQISRESGIAKTTVWKILRQHLHFYPHKFRVQQTLSPEHMIRRKNFCVQFLEMVEHDVAFLRNLLVSDEANFYVEGIINRHNHRFWSSNSPEHSLTKCAFSKKIMVWFGFTSTFCIPPVFVEGTLNSERYCDLLKNSVFPAVRAHHKFQSIQFMLIHYGFPEKKPRQSSH